MSWWSRNRARSMPEPEFYPDARRPRPALGGLDKYRGMPVAITYRPRSRSVLEDHIVIRCVVVGTLSDPPRLIVSVRGEQFKLPLDRVASVTMDINTE